MTLELIGIRLACSPMHCATIFFPPQVDVTVNNMLACANTKLLADYCAIDGRLAPLVALVKHWAKNRAVNDAYRGGQGSGASFRHTLQCTDMKTACPACPAACPRSCQASHHLALPLPTAAGTLSSYCYVLMCIHLLQTRPVPVLPVLQQLPATFRRTVGQWTCEFCDDVSAGILLQWKHLSGCICCIRCNGG